VRLLQHGKERIKGAVADCHESGGGKLPWRRQEFRIAPPVLLADGSFDGGCVREQLDQGSQGVDREVPFVFQLTRCPRSRLRLV
jgi:hypothetical protein